MPTKRPKAALFQLGADDLPGDRNLTEEDVGAIVDEMERRMVERFFSNVGKGVWNLVWRALVVLMAVVAAYGASKGMK